MVLGWLPEPPPSSKSPALLPACSTGWLMIFLKKYIGSRMHANIPHDVAQQGLAFPLALDVGVIVRLGEHRHDIGLEHCGEIVEGETVELAVGSR